MEKPGEGEAMEEYSVDIYVSLLSVLFHCCWLYTFILNNEVVIS